MAPVMAREVYFYILIIFLNDFLLQGWLQKLHWRINIAERL